MLNWIVFPVAVVCLIGLALLRMQRGSALPR
jgi:hypothetical protein